MVSTISSRVAASPPTDSEVISETSRTSRPRSEQGLEPVHAIPWKTSPGHGATRSCCLARMFRPADAPLAMLWTRGFPRCVRGNRGGVNRARLHHGETPWQCWLVANPPGRNIRVRRGGLVVALLSFLFGILVRHRDARRSIDAPLGTGLVQRQDMLAGALLHQVGVEKRARTAAEDDVSGVVDDDLDLGDLADRAADVPVAVDDLALHRAFGCLEPALLRRLLRAAGLHAHPSFGDQPGRQLASRVGREVFYLVGGLLEQLAVPVAAGFDVEHAASLAAEPHEQPHGLLRFDAQRRRDLRDRLVVVAAQQVERGPEQCVVRGRQITEQVESARSR